MSVSVLSPRLGILGPLRLRRGGVELEPGPRRQALLLAVLLARAGQPISVSDLVGVIWAEDAPPTAVNVIQKHVSSLRRLLEPGLPHRDSGAYLRFRGNAYLFAADSEVVDVVAFRNVVRAAEAALTERQREVSLDHYGNALRLWRGPAGDGLGGGPAAKYLFAALDEEFFTACVAAAELAVSLGRAHQVLRPLRLAASMAPLHEPVQASLIAALNAAGQRPEALSRYAAVRDRLADDLGIDPGPALREVGRQISGQPHAPAAVAEENGSRLQPGGLVGRADELTVLRQSVKDALAGRSGLVVVEGEPGVGKTRLLEEVSAEAQRHDAHVAWGPCLEGGGTPLMWPWVRVVRSILDSLPAADRDAWVAGELGRLVTPDDDALDAPLQPGQRDQFRLFGRVVGVAAHAASRRRLVLIMDDLQWADPPSLDLFGHLARELPAGVTLLGAFRTYAPIPGSNLTRMLAGVSRVPGHRRIHLGPLDQDEVTELVRRVTGRKPTTGVSRDIRDRTGGNPFFVRELSRTLAAGGAFADRDEVQAQVPATVRDIVQYRMTGLDETTRGLLRIAALIGRQIDVGLLARAADLEVQVCLRHLESAEELGLIGPAPGNPFSVRFAHDLVRESVASAMPPQNALQLHLRIADGLEHADPGTESIVERLAHHLWAAGPVADSARTVAALVRAGRRAAALSVFVTAERHLRSAAGLARSANLAEAELAALSQLTMILAMQRGYVGAPADILERCEELARGLGRELEATTLQFSRWTGYSQGVQIASSGQLARQLHERGEASADLVIRTYGRLAWALHQWEIGEIGEAYRDLQRCARAIADGSVRRENVPLLRDQKLLTGGMLGLMTTLYGNVAAARAHFSQMRADAADDPYAVTFWATFAALSATLVGDPQWALTAAEQGIAVDPDLNFGYLGTHQRLARCWGQAMLGEDPGKSAAELERLIAGNLLDPPRSCIVTWYGALAEVHLAIGAPAEAQDALDRAELALDRYGQRYSEGLIRYLRARLSQARGEPDEVVRAAAVRTRELATEREAHLFSWRLDKLERVRVRLR